jgi:hypothetical protein
MTHINKSKQGRIGPEPKQIVPQSIPEPVVEKQKKKTKKSKKTTKRLRVTAEANG